MYREAPRPLTLHPIDLVRTVQIYGILRNTNTWSYLSMWAGTWPNIHVHTSASDSDAQVWTSMVYQPA